MDRHGAHRNVVSFLHFYFYYSNWKNLPSMDKQKSPRYASRRLLCTKYHALYSAKQQNRRSRSIAILSQKRRTNARFITPFPLVRINGLKVMNSKTDQCNRKVTLGLSHRDYPIISKEGTKRNRLRLVPSSINHCIAQFTQHTHSATDSQATMLPKPTTSAPSFYHTENQKRTV